MKITLIGMSGLGKSYWSLKMADSGFRRFSCDEMITQKLMKNELTREDGSIMDLGEWMHFPYQPEYQSKADIYLETERKVLLDILDYLENSQDSDKKNVVVDTTGSFIYMSDEILE